MSTNGIWSVGHSGNLGGTLAGFQRVAKMLGQPVPKTVQGAKGQGRASELRSYTITATHLPTGRKMSRTIGPAYWSKKRWQAERKKVATELLAKMTPRRAGLTGVTTSRPAGSGHPIPNGKLPFLGCDRDEKPATDGTCAGCSAPIDGPVCGRCDRAHPTRAEAPETRWVICGFPGVGKSYLANSAQGVRDSDSSHWGWMLESCDSSDRVRHSEWPHNYIRHIQALLQREDVTHILVSSHKEVRDALVDADIPFILVYPELSIKDEYIQRYIDRGNAQSFVKLLTNNYEAWIKGLMGQECCEHLPLSSGQYLSEVLGNGNKA